MKKVINITLGSIVFAIEQDAYDVLASYLESIQQHLSSGDDYTEIISDIESALAEKFIARKRSEKVAVTTDDVRVVTKEMGEPSDFGAGEAPEHADTSVASAKSDEAKKRLYRDTDDSIIAGVASGIAHYFAIDPVVVRIVFFVSVFFNGLGVLAYGILWLVVPKAETTTQKYAARGERVTLKEITQRVKKNLEKIDVSDLTKVQNQGTWAGIRPTFVKMFEVLGVVVRGLLMIVRFAIGFGLLLGGSFSLAGLVSAYSIVLLSDRILLPLDAQTAVDTMLGSTLGIVAISASFVMMAIPLLVLILAGGSLLVKRSLFTVGKSITLAVMWIIAMVFATTASMLQLEQVMQQLDIDNLENGQYQIHVNIDDDKVHIDTEVIGVDEDVPSAPPLDTVHDLPDDSSIVCTDAQKQAQACTMEYAPVCGLVQVQCITAPCPPVEETFGNGCSACAQGNVESYTAGECSLPEVL